MNYIITSFPFWNYIPKSIKEDDLKLFEEFLNEFNKLATDKKNLIFLEKDIKIFPMDEFYRLHNRLINNLKTINLKDDKLFVYHLPNNKFLNYDDKFKNENVIVLNVDYSNQDYVIKLIGEFFKNIDFKKEEL